MDTQLRILHLEDDPLDAELVRCILLDDGISCQITRVITQSEYMAALGERVFDLILADYSLPSFDGLQAQSLAQEQSPDVPFIFVSGTLGEEVAIERMKGGAIDYVLKQNLSRLPPAVRRAMGEAEERKRLQRAEREIRELNAALEQRVAERTAELQMANAGLARREAALVESQGRLQAVLDYSPAVIYMKDLEGRYALANRQFCTLAGISERDVIGRTDRDLFPAEAAEIYMTNDRRIISAGIPEECEEPGALGDRDRVYASTKSPLYDSTGVCYGICGISIDVTARRAAEEQAQLAKREADQANRAKSEFLSRMSHDLRTPLNGILGFAQLLELDAVTNEQRENIAQILSGGRHLLELINEVLDISRIEAGHLRLSTEPVGVAETVQEVVELIAPLAAARGIHLRTSVITGEPRYVLADLQRLKQILLNLLSNAVKYNREHGRITVWGEETTAGQYRVSIADTGFGITPEKLALLFRPFERLGADQTDIEGTGLGLALSKGLAEAMNGTLGVTSDVGRGSTFWIELPTAAAPPAQKDGVPQELIPEKDRAHAVGTLLSIEDNPANMRLIERVLARRPKVRLVGASRGSQGLELARAEQPDLIFLDLQLPDMAGEEVLRRLKEDSTTKSIPVVILSADATPSMTTKLLAAGASTYLTKPLNINRILRLLDETMTRVAV